MARLTAAVDQNVSRVDVLVDNALFVGGQLRGPRQTPPPLWSTGPLRPLNTYPGFDPGCGPAPGRRFFVKADIVNPDQVDPLFSPARMRPS